MFWESWESAACLARLLRSVYGLSWAASPTCLWGGVQTSACLWVVLCVMWQPSVLDTFARPQPVHADPLSRQVAARGAAAADADAAADGQPKLLQGINSRNINAFVEQIHGEQDLDFPIGQRAQSRLSFIGRTVTPHGN